MGNVVCLADADEGEGSKRAYNQTMVHTVKSLVQKHNYQPVVKETRLFRQNPMARLDEKTWARVFGNSEDFKFLDGRLFQNKIEKFREDLIGSEAMIVIVVGGNPWKLAAALHTRPITHHPTHSLLHDRPADL